MSSQTTANDTWTTPGTDGGGKERDFWIGLSLAVSSSLFIGASFILKKKALIRLVDGGAGRAGAGGHGYLRDWMWWAGVLTMGLGEGFNFVAYAFAPASLVTPLGALSVLVTTVLSSRLLGEQLNLLGKLGCAVCLIGSTVIVLHSPKEENVATMQELGRMMQEAGWIVYVVAVVGVALFLVFYVAPRLGSTNILVYVLICSLIGSLSVVGCKGVGLAVKETLEGDDQLGNPFTWFWLVSVILCVTVQLNYLNKSLDLFNTSMVTPIYYVFFTTFTILASGILFKEWESLGILDIVGNVCGFAVVVIGIFQMQLFKDLNLSLRQVRHLVSKRGSVSSFATSLDHSMADSIPLLHDSSPTPIHDSSSPSPARASSLPLRRPSFSELPETDRPMYTPHLPPHR